MDSEAVNDQEVEVNHTLARRILAQDSVNRNQQELALLQEFFKTNSFLAQESLKLKDDRETLRLLYKSL
jgi:hypothetical protein